MDALPSFRPGRRARWSVTRAALLAAAGLWLLSACGTPAAAQAASAVSPGASPVSSPAATVSAVSLSPPAASRPPATAIALPPPAPFEEALARAAEALFAQAHAQLGDEARVLVFDPVIDGGSGARTASTAAMVARLEDLVGRRAGRPWTVRPLVRESLETPPLLLIGSLTPVNTVPGALDTEPDAFRIWLTLIDLRTRRVVAKSLDRATAASVDPTPLPYYRDSPAWHLDRSTRAYLDSCQVDTRVGDLADPYYLARLPAAALINEAVQAYDQGRIPLSNQLFDEASPFAGPGDLRVLNGLYATHWQMGQRDEARAALDRLVRAGIASRRLPMKVLFRPGSAAFDRDRDLPEQHGLWIRAIAAQVAAGSSCLRVVGHTGRAGSANARQQLSRLRAETVQHLMEKVQPELAPRLSSEGMGSTEALVGLGTEDTRDGLDRRVEFRIVDCL